MIPGVGFFYSGLLRRKNALSMIWMSMMTLAVVSFQVSILPAVYYPAYMRAPIPWHLSGCVRYFAAQRVRSASPGRS